MNIQAQRWLINRRTFLRGTATALGLPLLDAMLPARAGAQTIAQRPRRSVFIYVPNGVNAAAWFPQQDGREFGFSSTLKPLEPLRDHLSVVSGLHHPNAKNGHTVADNWLTGAALDATPGYRYRNSISADQIMAEQLAGRTRFPSLELSSIGGTGKQGGSSTLAWTRGAVAMPADNNPRSVFERFFTNSPGGAVAMREALSKDQSLLDTVKADADSLARRIGKRDQEMLDEYLTAVREIEQRVQRAEKWADIPKPAAQDDFIAAASFREDVGGYLTTMYDLMALAIRTDSTRVLSYLVEREASAFTIPETGIKFGHHALSHHNNDPRLMADLATLDTFLVQQLARFLTRLQSTTEGDGTLLDHTMVMYGSGASWTHLHLHLPILLAGGSRLGLTHGQHLDLSKAGQNATATDRQRANEETNLHAGDIRVNPDARMSNLLLTMMHAMGIKQERFADSSGPISQLLT